MATVENRNGRYKITVSCGYDMNGKQIRKSTNWTPPPDMTQRQISKELARQMVLFEERCKNGQALSGRITLAEFSDIWFSDYAAEHLRKSTVHGYKRMLPRVLKAMGHMKLESIQPHHLLAFYNNLREPGIREDEAYIAKESLFESIKKSGLSQTQLASQCNLYPNIFARLKQGRGVRKQSAQQIADALGVKMEEVFEKQGKTHTLSGNTVQHYHNFISSMLTTAVHWQLIYANPCKRISKPKFERKEEPYLDKNQITAFLDAINTAPEQYKTMVMVLLYTGMRRGELCGLEWSDVDLDTGLLVIRRTSLYLPGQGVLTDTTKTKSSQRMLKLPEAAITLLQVHKRNQNLRRLQMGDLWKNSERIFTTDTGAAMNPDTFTSWFSRFSKEHGFAHIGSKAMRHTTATLLIAAGVDVKTVSTRMGHSNISTTCNIYAHAIQSAEAAAADALQDVLQPAKKSKKRA